MYEKIADWTRRNHLSLFLHGSAMVTAEAIPSFSFSSFPSFYNLDAYTTVHNTQAERRISSNSCADPAIQQAENSWKAHFKLLPILPLILTPASSSLQTFTISRISVNPISTPIEMLSVTARSYEEAGALSSRSPTPPVSGGCRSPTTTPVSYSIRRASPCDGGEIGSRGRRVPTRKHCFPTLSKSSN